MPTLIATFRSFATYAVVSLYVLLFGPPLLLWTLVTSRPLALYRVGAGGAAIGLW